MTKWISASLVMRINDVHVFSTRGEYSLEFLVGVCCPVSQILTPFQTKNFVISTPVFRPGMLNLLSLFRPVIAHKTVLYMFIWRKLCHHHLDYNANKTISWNLFWILILLFLSYSFRIESTNTFLHSLSYVENHTRFQTKMGKVFTRFQTKTARKHFPLK